ncbi:DegT/DnrJ/EryC1/StrS family aminotransferase [Patescibacteria group bacterium]
MKKDKKNIKLMSSTFYNEKETKKSLNKFIKSAQILSMGKETAQFEKEFSKKQKRKYAVYVNSGGSANLVLLQTLLNLGKIKKGAKIGVTALTWGTNVMPIIQLGLIPIVIDVSLSTLNVSPEILKQNICNIDVFFTTNVLGFSDKMNEIKKICEKNKILFIEDNCEALGSMVGNKLLGNFGFASTFSFFVAHHISTIEGGMIVTDDEELYNALVMTRANGWDRNLQPDKQKFLRKKEAIDEFYSKYTFYDLAYNVRPTDITAHIGRLQLKFWDKIVKTREKNFNFFHKIILKNSKLMHFDLKHMTRISNFSIPIVAKDEETCKYYKNLFAKQGVETRPIIAGNIAHQPFYKKYVKNINKQPNADLIHKNGFYFTNNPEISIDDKNILKKLLKK